MLVFMIEIDGAYGEGGGQVLRTALSLAAIANQPFCLTNIRAGRKKPGLAAQHLTCVRAAAAICGAKVRGDALGSMFLEFIPQFPVQAGNYLFDVAEARQGGSAGAVTLVLQTVLLPLVLAQGESFVKLRGGTHVAFSPPVTYIDAVYLPILRQMGADASLKLNAWGWYPRGGGEVDLRLGGSNQLQGIELVERGGFKQVQILAAVTELPLHIPQRMAARAEAILKSAGMRANAKTLRETGIGAGAGLFLTAEYRNCLAGFSSIGELKVTSEKVAEIACEQFLAFHQANAPVEEHLADQLLLAAALAHSPSQYKVQKISLHLTTNAWVIEQFGLAKIAIDESSKLVTVEPAAR